MAEGGTQRTGNSFLGAIQQLPRDKQVVLAVLVLTLLAGVGGLVYWAQQPEYTVLFSDLSQGNAASVVQELEQRGVPYELVQGGTMVRVPSGRVEKLRLDLAQAGLPESGRKEYSLFDKQDVVGMSSFAQRLNYQRALEGELQRTIQGLGSVEEARVHLVMPDQALFEKDQKATTASVTLHTGGSGGVSQGSVDGVVHMVASAVEGLSPDNVTVVDGSGRVLNGDDSKDKKTGPGDELMAYKEGLESDLEKQLTSMLERVVGQGQAEVRVNTEINDEKVQVHETSYDPFSQVERSEQTRTRIESAQDQPGGEAGARANVPEAGQQEGGGGGTQPGTRVEEKTVNYELSKTVRDVLKPGGGIERLTVAVMVDGQYTEGPDGGRQFEPLGQQRLDSLRSLVADAAGVQPDRGDQVTVRSLPMEGGPRAARAGVTAPNWWELAMQGIRYGGYVLVTFLVFWFVVRPMLRYLGEMAPARQEQVAYEGATPEAMSKEAADRLERGQARTEDLEELEQRRQEIEERAEAEEERREHVRSVVQSEQDKAVSVVRQWLREDSGQSSEQGQG